MGAVLTDEAPLPGLGIEDDPDLAAETFSDGLGRVVAHGTPRPWRRTGFNRKTGARFVTKKDLAEREPIAVAWIQQAGGATAGSDPVEMEVEFVFDRPKTHYGTGRNATLLKNGAPRYPGQNLGDLDNLTKLVKDALNGIAYHDDTQVVRFRASKRWAAAGERSHTLIQIRFA